MIKKVVVCLVTFLQLICVSSYLHGLTPFVHDLLRPLTPQISTANSQFTFNTLYETIYDSKKLKINSETQSYGLHKKIASTLPVTIGIKRVSTKKSIIQDDDFFLNFEMLEDEVRPFIGSSFSHISFTLNHPIYPGKKFPGSKINKTMGYSLSFSPRQFMKVSYFNNTQKKTSQLHLITDSDNLFFKSNYQVNTTGIGFDMGVPNRFSFRFSDSVDNLVNIVTQDTEKIIPSISGKERSVSASAYLSVSQKVGYHYFKNRTHSDFDVYRESSSYLGFISDQSSRQTREIFWSKKGVLKIALGEDLWEIKDGVMKKTRDDSIFGNLVGTASYRYQHLEFQRLYAALEKDVGTHWNFGFELSRLYLSGSVDQFETLLFFPQIKNRNPILIESVDYIKVSVVYNRHVLPKVQCYIGGSQLIPFNVVHREDPNAQASADTPSSESSASPSSNLLDNGSGGTAVWFGIVWEL